MVIQYVPDWLEITVKILHGVFFITIATIAVLTFLFSRKTLLSPIHTEVQKMRLERLKQLSDELRNYASRESFIRYEKSEKKLARFLLEKTDNQGELLKVFEWVNKLRENIELGKLINEFESDPFLPKHIRNEVVSYLNLRKMALCDSFLKALIETRKAKKPEQNLNIILAIHEHSFKKKLEKLDLLPQNAETTVKEFRLKIQDYFDSFDPLK